jgi:type VI protein secretion system component VasK
MDHLRYTMADSKRTWLVTMVGVVVLIAFGAFVTYLIRQVAASEQAWSRMVYLYGGVEAIAFAAAGYFFGREVHRERADNAEKKEAKSAEEAKASRAESSKAQERIRFVTTLLEHAKPTGRSLVAEDLKKLGQLHFKAEPDANKAFMNFVDAIPADQVGSSQTYWEGILEALKAPL